MTSNKLLIAVPMKNPKNAKTRLRKAMNDTARAELAQALFERTLDMIADSHCDVDVLVVTESNFIAQLCKKRDLHVYHEAKAQGLNTAAANAATWASDNGYIKLAILPADLALLSPADVQHLADFSVERGHVLLCEATDGGTNCMVLSPPDAISFQYGPGSFRAHRRAVMAAGLICHVLRNSDMRFDVDTSQDLRWVQSQTWQNS